MSQAPKYDETKSLYDNRRTIDYVKKLFFQDYEYPAIFLATRIPIGVFNRFAYLRTKNSWKIKRDKIKDEILNELVRGGASIQKLSRIMGLSLEILERHLYRLNVRASELTIQEAKLVAGILKDLHGIKQLETGEATSIVKYDTMTPSELSDAAISLVRELQQEDDIVSYRIPELEGMPVQPNSIPLELEDREE